MIRLMQAMLVEHVRDSMTGHEVMNPVNLIWVDDTARSISPIDFPLKIVALVYVTGGHDGEELTVSGTIRGPDVAVTRLPEQRIAWRGQTRVMDLVLGIDMPVKMNDGGLYHLNIQVNHQPLANLPFFLVWKSEEQVPQGV